MAQRNVEWYSVHTNGVELREMAQPNVEWYSVHINSVALREMARVANSHVDSVTPFRSMILLCQRSSHFSNN